MQPASKVLARRTGKGRTCKFVRTANSVKITTAKPNSGAKADRQSSSKASPRTHSDPRYIVVHPLSHDKLEQKMLNAAQVAAVLPIEVVRAIEDSVIVIEATP
jgi:hypothetical protein